MDESRSGDPVAATWIHLAVALDGAGWHPAAWREPAARPRELWTARYWADLVGEAERGLLDFVTVEDSLGMDPSPAVDPDGRTDQVRGRLDALLVAARVAPLTTHVGVIPTVVATHTEPFHASKAIATLDYVTGGRAGVGVQVSGSAHEAALFGRRPPPPLRDLCAEAAEYVEVMRRLWDSWEDDAEIRDVATGRFIDRSKLHYIDFRGRYFSVKGPSITPRPPQGQPIVSTLAHEPAAYQLVGRSCDLGYVTPRDVVEAGAMVTRIRAAQAAAGRRDGPVHIFGDLVVFLDGDRGTGRERKARLDALAGAGFRSDAMVFTGDAAQLADLLVDWREAGLTGFRLRPGTIPDDLYAITRGLVPELQRRGVFRPGYDAGTLRERLGLPRPPNRYAASFEERDRTGR